MQAGLTNEGAFARGLLACPVKKPKELRAVVPSIPYPVRYTGTQTLAPKPKQTSIGGTYYAKAIVLGDLNNDGKLDIVIANDAFANFSVALGKGNGTFGKPTFYSSGLPGASAVLIGDSNHDGKQDLAVAGYNPVAIIVGNGDGTFRTGATYTVGFVPMWMTSGDFNGDGALDLAISNVGSSNISVLLGKGDGTFQTAKNYPVKNAGNLISLDLNHDGILDLVATNTNSLVILFGNGDGTFHFGKSVPAPASQLAALDVNGDGNVDLVFTETGGIGVSLGNAGGTLQKALSFFGGNYPNFLGVADFNGDGRPDVVVTGANGVSGGAQSLTVLLNETTQ